MNGRTAIVTGASRGIGRAIALRLAAEGARVVLCARDQAALDAAVREVARAGGVASALSLDLRERDAAPSLVEFALCEYGRIDVIVNNAGATRRGEFHDLTDEDWADGFALKFFGTVRLTRAAWPHLKANSGSVVNIAGIGGRTPGPQFTIGGSVNAALQSFTKAMADVGIRDGVQVNVINPGAIRTARYTRRIAALAAKEAIDSAVAEQRFIAEANITRVGEPEDVAALVAFVVGPQGRLLQGAMIDMDGGATKTL